VFSKRSEQIFYKSSSLLACFERLKDSQVHETENTRNRDAVIMNTPYIAAFVLPVLQTSVL